MPSTLVLTVKSDNTQALLQQLFQQDENKDREVALELVKYFKALAMGSKRGQLDVQTGSAQPVRASGTWTLTSVVATDTVTIAGITFTFTSTPTLETDVEVDGVDDTADAAALAAAINAHSTLQYIVKCTSALGVVTVECRQSGVVGNAIEISDADTTIETSGATLENGAGGAMDDEVSFNLGLS